MAMHNDNHNRFLRMSDRTMDPNKTPRVFFGRGCVCVCVCVCVFFWEVGWGFKGGFLDRVPATCEKV